MSDISNGDSARRKTDERELKIYEEICNNIRTSDDISFKLLGLVPLVSGSGAAILTLANVKSIGTIIFLSLIAAAVTFGLFKWEMRNIQKCDWLIQRAADIENAWFTISQSNSAPEPARQFSGWSAEPKPPLLGKNNPSDSPPGKTPKGAWYQFGVGKTRAERIVYWTSISAWLLPIAVAAMKGCPQ